MGESNLSLFYASELQAEREIIAGGGVNCVLFSSAIYTLLEGLGQTFEKPGYMPPRFYYIPPIPPSTTTVLCLAF